MAGRMEPADRRAFILDTARDVFTEAGFRGVSMRAIARACDMTAPGVMHYFPTVDDILIAVLERREREGIEFARAEGASGLEDAVERMLARWESRPEEVRLYNILEGEAVNPSHPAHDFFRRRIDDEAAALAELLSDGYENPEELAYFLTTVFEGLRARQSRDPGFSLREGWNRVREATLAAGTPKPA